MQVNLSGHHVDITTALREYVNHKFERIERHFDHMTNIHVVLSVEKQRQKAEATIHVAGADIHADEESGDMYAAIDVLVDKLDRQVCRIKEKRTDHHRAEGSLKSQPAE
jgi:putative sigma-54 modulation protein